MFDETYGDNVVTMRFGEVEHINCYLRLMLVVAGGADNGSEEGRVKGWISWL